MLIQSITTYEELQQYFKKYKYIIVNISATWCKPCMEIKPLIEKFISVLDTDEKDYIYLKIDEGDYSSDVQFEDLFHMKKIPYFAILKTCSVEDSFDSFVSGDFSFVSKRIFEYIKHENLINNITDFKTDDEDF
jgi:thiol-disulfide isomerase/thioredoxin